MHYCHLPTGMAINVYQNSGDPNTNWSWFEQQKKAKANLRFRLSLGSPDDKDGLDEHHGGALSAICVPGALHRCCACGDPQRLEQCCGRSTGSMRLWRGRGMKLHIDS